MTRITIDADSYEFARFVFTTDYGAVINTDTVLRMFEKMDDRRWFFARRSRSQLTIKKREDTYQLIEVDESLLCPIEYVFNWLPRDFIRSVYDKLETLVISYKTTEKTNDLNIIEYKKLNV